MLLIASAWRGQGELSWSGYQRCWMGSGRLSKLSSHRAQVVAIEQSCWPPASVGSKPFASDPCLLNDLPPHCLQKQFCSITTARAWNSWGSRPSITSGTNYVRCLLVAVKLTISVDRATQLACATNSLRLAMTKISCAFQRGLQWHWGAGRASSSIINDAGSRPLYVHPDCANKTFGFLNF